MVYCHTKYKTNTEISYELAQYFFFVTRGTSNFKLMLMAERNVPFIF